MATPSAILSVLVSANTTEATAKLTQYQRQLDKAEVASKRGIQARLGGSFNDDAFKKYQAATANAARKAADRRAFKAQLGANFSTTGFRAYEKELNAAAAATSARSAQMRDTMRRNFAQAGQFAAVGIGVAGVAVGKLAVDFDRAMRNVNSIAQLPERQFKALEKSVLSLAGKTAQAPKTLAEGLYDLVSSGFDAKQSMLILASSAKAATAGLTDTATSTHAVAAVLNAYHRPAKDAAAISDTLFQTVNLGVISFEQLASTIGDVLPFASQLHVNLNQVGAAVSTMTKAGIGPEETMTRLKNVLVAFIKPSVDMTKAIKATGAASGEALIKQKGLQGALEAIVGTTDGTKSALAALFPNIRGLGGALALTGSNAKGADKDLKAFSNTSGATNKALSQQSQSVSYQWQKLRATLESLAISFANKAIPAILQFVQQIKDGTGAGGQFASAIKNAFNVVKTVVHTAVDELGGLKSAIEVLAGGYAVSRVLKFAGALGQIAGGARGATGAVAGAGGGAVGALGKVGGVLSRASALAMLLPVGIALGAVLDHWIQTNAQAEGKKFADKFLAPMPDAIKQHFQQPIADAANRIDSIKIGQRVAGQVSALGTRASGVSSDAAKQLAASAAGADAAAIRAQYFKIGQEAGQATVAGLKSVRDISAPILLQDFLGRLQQLPAQARPEAAKAMISYAAELQAKGQLPVQAVQQIMHRLEAQIPGFSTYLQQQGLASDQALARALRFNTATGTLRNTLAGYRKQFGDWQISTKITGSNIVQNMAAAMDHLHQTVKSSSGQTRRDAVAELKKLHDQATSLFSSMADKVAQAAKDMRGSITSSTSQAAKDAASNLSGLANAVYGGVKSGAVNSKQGAQYIQRALNATLKAFGATQIPAVTLKEVALSTPFAGNVGAFPKAGVGGGGKPAGAARGGLMQIGRYGQAGRDSVPLNVGGMPVMVAPGEQVAVFNRHQLPIVNQALAPMGGLPGLFSKVRKPNYMAQGGLVPRFAGGGSVSYGQLEGLWDKAGGPASMAPLMAAIAEAESRGNPLARNSSGALGLWQIRGLPFPGNVFDPLTNARMAVAKWHSQGLGAWTTYTSGAYKQFLQGGVPPGAVGGGLGQIAAPRVEGGGMLGNLLRAGLGKVADAANAVIGRLAPAGGGPTGFVGAPGGPMGVGSYMGVAMANWVIDSLQYAARKGIRPRPTSGYRPGFDPHTATGVSEHAGTQYPHGAVDFGGYHDPVALANKMAVVAATRDFKWPLLAPIGFVDDGHASGTGHARGGLLPSFAGGGITGAGNAVASANLPAQRAKGLSLMQRIWGAAHALYPGAGSALPATHFMANFPLVGDVRNTSGGRAGQFIAWPDWMNKWLIGNRPTDRSAAEETLVHEWAHYFQSRKTANAGEWQAEGGAQAFTREHAAAIMAAARLPFGLESRRSDVYFPFVQKVRRKLGEKWINRGQFEGRAHGGALPFAGSFDAGGTVPGPRGMPSMAIVHGGERFTGLAGGGIAGAGAAGLRGLASPSVGSAGSSLQKVAAGALTFANLLNSLATIPSQAVPGQIQLQGLQNQVQTAQNAGNVGGQRSALTRILKLEQGWLSADRGQLKRVNRALRKRGLSKKQRGQLLQDKLALLQEIGTIEADIGSTQTSLSDLSTVTDTTGGGDTGATGADATQALADAQQALAQALTDATAAINQQTMYMQSVGAVETSQAIKALSDVISGQIGGLALSRQSGSAGDGRVARY